MKATRTIVALSGILAAAGLAVCLTLERQACARLGQENDALRRQLSQRDGLLAENQRLSNLVAQATGPPSRPGNPVEATPAVERVKELVRLRAEVAALRRQGQEIEALRADTRQVRAVWANGLKTQNAAAPGTAGRGTATDGSQLEILAAEYGTANTNMDVAAELRERIRGGSLKAVASNNLKGDPEFGQVKNLTVVYRFGGVTRTNQFRENDLVILPAE